MADKIFKTIDNLTLVIRNTKTFLIFEMIEESKDYRFSFRFDEEVFQELTKYIENIANEIWGDFTPKEAKSLRSDYSEYYDRKLDNNGYLDIIDSGFKIERPSLESSKLYQFNKGKLESLCYDFNKKG